MVEAKDVVKHELIGLDVEVTESTNKDAVGVKGRVIDETRNMLVIETEAGEEKSLVKEQCTFLFTVPEGGKVSIEGRLLVARPEDRIKKKLKKW
jgi:ribonuclease P protein subunit POP4